MARPRGPAPALVALTVSSAFLFVAVLMVDSATEVYSFSGDESYIDYGLLGRARLMFVASVATGIGAGLLWLVRDPPPAPTVQSHGALAPAVALAELGTAFLDRLNRTLQVVGGLVVGGGLGLVTAASLLSDGDRPYPFASIPGKIWVIGLNVWQVHVTVWAVLLLALGFAIWCAEYRWLRRVRADWKASLPPEV